MRVEQFVIEVKWQYVIRELFKFSGETPPYLVDMELEDIL